MSLLESFALREMQDAAETVLPLSCPHDLKAWHRT